VTELFGRGAWQAASSAFAAAFAGRSADYERRLTHLGATARWTRVQVFPDRDAAAAAAAAAEVEAVYTIAFEIHDDMVEREALVAARRRLDRFTENIPYPLTHVDRDFVLRFVNRAPVCRRPAWPWSIWWAATSGRPAALHAGPSTGLDSNAR
jgi:hypothetical protein